MTYIGPEPNPGQNREVDDISSSFNGSTTAFTLQVNSQNVSPGSANAIIVSVGGVIQNPGTDYTVAASTLTFTTAPASGLAFFGLVLGQQIDTEGTADASITASKLATNAVTTVKIADSTGASDGVTTAKIATSAITTAKIADQAVDLSKLPHGDGSSDGKFLRSNNGADPTFETVSAGTSLTGSTDNTITTVTGANAIQGEANLTYDGTDFKVIKSNSSFQLRCESETPELFFNSNSVADAGRIKVAESGGGGVMIFYNKTTGGTSTEAFRINTDQSTTFGGLGYVANSAIVNIVKDGTHITCRSYATGGYDSIFFRSANTNVGKIHFNSGGTQYHTSSDYRRKENIVNLTGAIDRVKLLQPKRFNFITDSSTTLDGFLAHEVTPAVPEAILGTKDQVANAKDVEEGRADEIGDPIYQTIDQSTLIPLLTGALQEAISKIETLETKVAALEAA